MYYLPLVFFTMFIACSSVAHAALCLGPSGVTTVQKIKEPIPQSSREELDAQTFVQ